MYLGKFTGMMELKRAIKALSKTLPDLKGMPMIDIPPDVPIIT